METDTQIKQPYLTNKTKRKQRLKVKMAGNGIESARGFSWSSWKRLFPVKSPQSQNDLRSPGIEGSVSSSQKFLLHHHPPTPYIYGPLSVLSVKVFFFFTMLSFCCFSVPPVLLIKRNYITFKNNQKELDFTTCYTSFKMDKNRRKQDCLSNITCSVIFDVSSCLWSMTCQGSFNFSHLGGWSPPPLHPPHEELCPLHLSVQIVSSHLPSLYLHHTLYLPFDFEKSELPPIFSVTCSETRRRRNFLN